MATRTFTVFQDQDASSIITASCSKSSHLHSAATKENINPLTGLAFDSQPPLKKRKPSSSSALKVKPLPSSSKPSKSKRLSSTSSGKEKGRRKAVLGTIGTRNNVGSMNASDDAEAEQLRTALGNRNAYDLTVMPLADVTRAYDAGEMVKSMTHVGTCALDDGEYNTMGMILNALSEENEVEMCEITSKEISTPSQATQA